MPAITSDRTCVVIADKIPATQKEIVRMMLIQIFSFVDNVEVIDFYDSDKLQTYIESDEIPIVKVMDSWYCKDWDGTFRHFKVVLEKYYRNVIIINSPTFRFMKEEPVNLIKKYEEKCLQDPTYVFSTKGRKIHDRIKRLLFVKAASSSFGRNNVYQFCINPNEVDYRDVWNFKHYVRIGPWPWKNTEVGPTYEYALSHMYIQEIPKVQDLFWYACYNNKQDVKDAYDIIKVFLNKRTWVKNPKTRNPVSGECNIFDLDCIKKNAKTQDEYYYNMMCSKYTILTPTDDGSFPIVRLMEAIILGCIPMLYHTIKVDDLILIDHRFYDIIKWKNLYMPYFKLKMYENKKSNNTKSVHKVVGERFKLYYGEDAESIELFRKSSYYRNMTDEKKVADYYNKLLKGAKYPKRKG